MGGVFGGLFGGDDPEVEFDATETEGDKKKSRALRSALLGTRGGILGEELQPGEVDSRRDTFFS